MRDNTHGGAGLALSPCPPHLWDKKETRVSGAQKQSTLELNDDQTQNTIQGIFRHDLGSYHPLQSWTLGHRLQE